MGAVIQRLKTAIPIEEVVGQVVTLKAVGRGRLRGLCPFHNEKTPSFYVDTEKGLFHCFGCKAGGDVISFVQRQEGVAFKQAVQLLSERYNIALEPPDLTERILAAAQHEFAKHRKVAAELLEKRGFTYETLDAFKIGFAYRPLLTALKEAGFSVTETAEELRKLQILYGKNGSSRDLLQGRITIPIYSPSGDLLGWQGRANGQTNGQNGHPKYLTLVKSRQHLTTSLFGLPQARAALQESKEAILLEGPLDVMALHQMGEKNAVGLLGSKVHEAQLALLAQLGVTRVYLAFDGDEAGVKATLNTLGMEIARRFMVYIVRLPQGVDPADTLPSRTWEKYKSQATPEVTYRVRWALEGLNPRSALDQRAAIERLQPQISQTLDPVAEALRRELATACGLSLRQLERYLQLKPRRQEREEIGPNTTEEELVAGLLSWIAESGKEEEKQRRLDLVFRFVNPPNKLLEAGLEALVVGEYNLQTAQLILRETHPRLAEAISPASLRPQRVEAILVLLNQRGVERKQHLLQTQVRRGGKSTEALQALDALARLKGRPSTLEA